MQNNFIKHCLLAVMFLSPLCASAQLTAGVGKVPESFSILELVSSQQRGLRLPRLTTMQRDAMQATGDFEQEKTGEAMGLQIFNTTTRCVETWNGTQWIQSCSPEGPALPPEAIGVPSNCIITVSNANMTFTAKADPNAAAYEFFLDGVSQGEQSSNVLTLASAKNLSQVTVRYFYPPAFLKPKMIAVQGGTFLYGSHTQDSTNPVLSGTARAGSSVTLSDFFMSETEITQAQYEAVMGVNPASFRCGGGNASSVTTRPTSALPVEYVRWYDAITYCNKLSLQEGKTLVYSVKVGGVEVDWANPALSVPLSNNADWNAATQNLSANGYRLPTEAEWEYAARGGQQSESITGRNALDFYYSGSNDVEEVAWYSGNNGSSGATVAPYYGTKPVKTKKPNALGLYDMSGNVAEWCWDWFAYSHPLVSGTNPVGPASGTDRTISGHGWIDAASGTGMIHRYFNVLPASRNFNRGFRIVCSQVSPVPPLVPPITEIPDGDNIDSWANTQWVGAFWKNDQQGERIIRARNNSDWSVSVDANCADWVTLDEVRSSNAALWTDEPGNAEDYQITAGVSVLENRSGDILFRIGTKSTNPNPATPRYGTVTLTINGTAYKLFMRQGEEADYVFSPEDLINGGTGTGTARTLAAKFSPYNLTDAALNDTDVLSHQTAYQGGQFVDFPTKAGAFWQWGTDISNTATYAPYLRRAYHPVKPTGAPSVWDTDFTYPAANDVWGEFTGANRLETCPSGFRRPMVQNDNTATAPSDTGNTPANASELMQSLFYITFDDTTANRNNVNHRYFGYYADGFFDRRPVVSATGVSARPNSASAVSVDTKDVAYNGLLFTNPVTNASLFIPASGARNYITNGSLYYAGLFGYAWSSSAYTNNAGWGMSVSNTTSNQFDTQRTQGYTVRCVVDN